MENQSKQCLLHATRMNKNVRLPTEQEASQHSSMVGGGLVNPALTEGLLTVGVLCEMERQVSVKVRLLVSWPYFHH